MDFGGFISHFLILILHALSSLRPRQLTSGSDGDGGADGGSGSHKPQNFLHFFCFARFSHCLFLHFFAVSTHAGELGGGGGGGGDGGGGLALDGGGQGGARGSLITIDHR